MQVIKQEKNCQDLAVIECCIDIIQEQYCCATSFMPDHKGLGTTLMTM